MSDSNDAQSTTIRTAVLPAETLEETPSNWTPISEIKNGVLSYIPEADKVVELHRDETEDGTEYWDVKEVGTFKIHELPALDTLPTADHISEKLAEYAAEAPEEHREGINNGLINNGLINHWESIRHMIVEQAASEAEAAFWEDVKQTDGYIPVDKIRQPVEDKEMSIDVVISEIDHNYRTLVPRRVIRDFFEFAGIMDANPFSRLGLTFESTGESVNTAPAYRSEPETDWHEPELTSDYAHTALAEAGCTPAESTDYIQTVMNNERQLDWASKRDVSQSTVSQNVRAAKNKLSRNAE
ncbi:hypothetical protein C471_07706 [Halorubrum saccharovorum DSM 1137]|uniref:Uncharacterized protein n=2 Tax=Halorubrum saccharovorum TaxID=2248 RepID=M0DYT7_9EURY|nr:hypothetical protein C471_07706 [Halorubrum saccharovorum DSM 1137]